MADALPLKLLSPLYAAVIECERTGSDDVVRLAWPPDNATLPSVVAPSLKVTFPVGVLEPDEGLTLTMNVTDCPETEAVADEVKLTERARDGKHVTILSATRTPDL